jgi:predicted nucleic acid-binding protein
MILLDTNVLSEVWKPQPHPGVLAWLDDQVVDTLYLSAITVAELSLGVATMPEGRRRGVLTERLDHDILPMFADRVLPFDLDAARAYASLMARARVAGASISNSDGFIAAIAAARGYAVATRDVVPFATAGVAVINPWVTGRTTS